jgi:hypothetical protein
MADVVEVGDGDATAVNGVEVHVEMPQSGDAAALAGWELP